MTGTTLEVPGAILSYHAVGAGPLLLCIPGANGDASTWRPISHILSSSFTVCCYTRRGFKNSHLTTSQDYTPSVRLARDADDAAELIMHLSPGQPAYVLGSNTGAIISLELLRRHPDIIRMLIAHEPPVPKVLGPQEGPEVYGINTHMYDTYKAQGISAATEIFLRHVVKQQAEADLLRDAMANPANKKDVEYFFEHELTQYPALEPNYEALREHSGKIVLVFGRDSVGLTMQKMTEGVAEKTGAQVRMVPGGHLSFLVAPQAFAEAVVKILLPTPPSMWPIFVP